MRFRQLDVLGYQQGSLIAAELAIARPAAGAQSHAGRRAADHGRGAPAPDRPAGPHHPRQGRVVGRHPRAREYLPRARSLDLPQIGPSMFETPAEAAVGLIREFLGA